ncbi:hypothetical protein [Microbacterium sp. Se63.02b]|uniref:hypothetical protein n=1 Tax=Microbacterium sp. Se63.02b TaxID=2709304 RepID=UPI0031F6C91A
MSSRSESTSRSSAYRIAGIVILLAAALVALVLALLVGGGAEPPLLQDPGAFVLWGTPVAKLVMNISGAVMLGSLVLALFGLRAGDRSFDAALNIASVGAAVFTVSAGLAGFLAFMAAFNPKLSIEREFGTQLGRFLLELPLGQSWLITTIFGAIITVLAFAWRSWTPTLITALLAAVSFLPLATQGHAGDLDGHNMAVNSILLHTVGAAVWLGGLLLLVLLRGRGDVDVPASSRATRRSRSRRSPWSPSRASLVRSWPWAAGMRCGPPRTAGSCSRRSHC